MTTPPWCREKVAVCYTKFSKSRNDQHRSKIAGEIGDNAAGISDNAAGVVNETWF